jgi:thermitase
MEKRIISFLMLGIILSSTLSMAFVVRPSFAENRKNTVADENFTENTSGTALPIRLNQPDRTEGSDINWHSISEGKSETAQEKTSKSTGQTSPNGVDKWDFNDTSEWSSFAYLDGNKTRLIIGVKGESPASLLSLERIATRYQAEIVSTVSIGGKIRAAIVELLLVSVTGFVEEIREVGLASYIEPNMKVQAQLVPNDPYWSLQWGPQKIEADYAWDTTLGDPSVLVAVIDTGIDYTHPDLATNYVPLGYDWVNMDADPIDDHGHGTHCAGIIAAVLNNNVGIAGLAQVRVMAEKVLNSGGAGTWDWVANGIINATDCGADIISMSLGGYGDSELVHEAVKYAYDAGVLVIAAAGNDNTNMKSYPAGYDEVIAVAATDQYDNKAWFSNWGDWIELAAPGVDIYSTVPWGYESWSGTSMAAPHVSGVAALIWSRYPNKTNDWVRLWLRHTAEDLGDPGFDLYYGYGRINARNAVERTPPAHELIAWEWETPPYLEPRAIGIINATVLNFGESNETNVTVHLTVDDITVASIVIDFLASSSSATVSLAWNPTVEGLYNVTLCVLPVPGETNIENNVFWKYIYVGFPVKAVVLHSAGNVYSEIITNWQALTNNWYLFGDTMVYIDYTTLNKDGITYEDIVATGADVLIISCAYDPYAGWQFADSEIEAITQYVHEGHGLIATAGTLYSMVPNNNKLAPLFGLSEATMWTGTGTDLLHLLNTTHPIFANVPNPLIFRQVGTALPYDGRWDSNELVGGKYLALGHYQESAIVAYRGLVYISPWLEIIPPYYHHHLQLLYNAITWSRYQKPQHELAVSLQCPSHLTPGENALVNATVENQGLNNETNVKLFLLVNGVQVANLTVSMLAVGESATVSYFWAPSEGTYNVTTYAPPVPGEEYTLNNVKTVFSRVSYAVVIGFIETHGESLHTDGLKTFYESLGHIVVTLRSTLTPQLLADFDILIVGEDWSNNPWLPSEIEAVQAFIHSGKGFVGIGDELAYSVQQILSDYGIAYTGYYGYGGSSNNFDHLHPLMKDVNYIYASYPVNSLQAVPPGYWIASDAYNVYTLIAGSEAGGYVVCMSDDFAADLYSEDNEIMFTNMVQWMAVKQEHDLAVSLEAPKSIKPRQSALLNATVVNKGLSNETNVELQILIDGAVVQSTTIDELMTRSSYTLSHLWAPTVEGIYNVTAYALPVLNESNVRNNMKSTTVIVSALVMAIFENVIPWNYPSNEEVLNLYGVPYVVFSSNDFGRVDLNTFSKVVIASDQNQAFYDAINSYIWWFEDYVNNGGTLEIHAADWGWNGGHWVGTLPGGLQWTNYYADYVTIVDPVHPVVITPNRITDAELDGWSASVHGYFSVYPAASHIVIIEDYTRSPAYLEFPYGSGVIIASGQTLEWAYKWKYSRILENSLLYSAVRRLHDLAMFLEAPTILELGNSGLVRATVRNNGLSNETNVELFLLINGTVSRYETIPELLVSESYTINYLWTPTNTGNYNITAYATPVPEEEYITNNVAIRWASVFFYTRMYISHEWIGDGVPMGWHADDVSWQYDLPFDFPFYGICYRTIYISSNGLITFVGPDSSFSNSIPALAGKLAIAAAWDDWVTYDPYDIYIWQNSTHVGIRWCVRFIGTSTIANFEAILRIDGLIQLNYDYNDGPISSTIGISNGVSHILAEDATNLNCINSIIFAPFPIEHDVAIIDVVPSTHQVLAGETVNITVVAENQGMVDESFDVTVYASPSNSSRIYFDPSEYIFDPATVSIGSRFNVTLRISNVIDLGGWQIAMYYNDDIINVTRWFEPTWDPQYVFYGMTTTALPTPPEYAYEHWGPSNGSAMVTAMLFPPPPHQPSFAGSGKLCIFEFEIKAVPPEGERYFCHLKIDNDDTYMLDSEGEEILDVVKVDGYYQVGIGVPPPRYIVGTRTVVNLAPGANISLIFTWNTANVTPHGYVIWTAASVIADEFDVADNVYHDGIVKIVKPPVAKFTYSPVPLIENYPATFDASDSKPNGGYIISFAWNFGDGNITTTTDSVITHIYSSHGNFNITLTIMDSEGLTDTTWKLVEVLWHDVAIVDVVPSCNWVYQGWLVNINVSVANRGNLAEMVTVELYYNMTAGNKIGTKIFNLNSKETTTLTFVWNTTSTPACHNYTLTAVALISMDSDMTNNLMESPTKVKVRILGDINGDSKVDLKDVYAIQKAFGLYEGHPRWNPLLDLNGDGKIDLKDVYTVSRNYGKC